MECKAFWMIGRVRLEVQNCRSYNQDLLCQWPDTPFTTIPYASSCIFWSQVMKTAKGSAWGFATLGMVLGGAGVGGACWFLWSRRRRGMRGAMEVPDGDKEDGDSIGPFSLGEDGDDGGDGDGGGGGQDEDGGRGAGVREDEEDQLFTTVELHA